MRLPVASASILLESRRSPPTFRAAHRRHDAILPAMSDPLAADPFDDPQVSRPAVAPRPAPYLAALNNPHRPAAEALDGPVLVHAAAGPAQLGQAHWRESGGT